MSIEVHENADGTFTIELSDEERNALIGPAVEYALLRAMYNFVPIGTMLRWLDLGKAQDEAKSESQHVDDTN